MGYISFNLFPGLENPVWKESQWTHRPTIISLPSSIQVVSWWGRSWKGNCRSVGGMVRRIAACIKIYGGEFELRGKSQSRMEEGGEWRGLIELVRIASQTQDTSCVLEMLLGENACIWCQSVAFTPCQLEDLLLKTIGYSDVLAL